MTTGTKSNRGRKQKHFQAPWCGVVEGLTKQPDGRWRIIATGQRFTEPDERQAVAKYRQMIGRPSSQRPIEVTAPLDPAELRGQMVDVLRRGEIVPPAAEGERCQISIPVEPGILWPWLRKMLLEEPGYIARMTGLPAVGRIRHDDLPRQPIRLDAISSMYERNADVKPGTRRHVLRAWGDLMDTTKAQTLDDLTTDALTTFRLTVKTRQWGAEYVANVFTRIKMVLRFALGEGLDAEQIGQALARMAILKGPKRRKTYDPSPISRADFHALLKHADDLEAAALLLSLNAALYVSEVLAIDWPEIDLDRGTLVTSREKTGVIRAAALWPETVAALKKLKKTPGAIFRSSRGDRYHPNSFRKVFAALRTAAGVSADVEYNSLRDGAYSAACAAGVALPICQTLAGHRAPGMVDHYVSRNPEMTRPATDAIHRHYME